MTPTTAHAPRRRALGPRIVHSWQLYVLLAPALVYLAVFKYWPMYGAQIAFRNYSPAGGFFGSPWVGLRYFERLGDSFQFGQVLIGHFIGFTFF